MNNLLRLSATLSGWYQFEARRVTKTFLAFSKST